MNAQGPGPGTRGRPQSGAGTRGGRNAGAGRNAAAGRIPDKQTPEVTTDH